MHYNFWGCRNWRYLGLRLNCINGWLIAFPSDSSFTWAGEVWL